MNAPAMPTRPRILLFSSLYPSSARPGHGISMANRLRELVCSDALDAKVAAPVPWFYSTDPKHGERALMARTPLRETLFDIATWHPRYLLGPKVGTSLAPFAMAAGAVQTLRRLVRRSQTIAGTRRAAARLSARDNREVRT